MVAASHSSASNRKVKSKSRTTIIPNPTQKKKIRQWAAAAEQPLRIHRMHTGEINFVGRPAWTTEAEKISVNRDEKKTVNGILVPVEDRRHLLHWDEHLKPILNGVFTAMEKEFKKPGELLSELKKPIDELRYRTMAKTVDEYMIFVAKKINGSPDNLVPDRADINQAIEKVRANLRSYANALHEALAASDEFSNGPAYDAQGKPQLSSQAIGRMVIYKNMAREHLKFDPNLTGATPIREKVNAIQGEMLGLIDGFHTPHEVWTFLNDLQYSVTFDLSDKATRDKTSKSLAWHRLMNRNTEMPARQRYMDLLSFLV
ncbi:hypothetical protein AB3X96_05300 [Paraburkholderia sp. BR13439]|uniref:hypothetical protein n=1 Tax=Paraburkholderia TaxID=1822464 RepID=UPI0034CD5959